MLQITNLSHRYPGAASSALYQVSLSAQRSQILGLLGPNGAGKTTLISHLTGALPLQQGHITIDDQPLSQVRRTHPTRVAVAPQEYAFYPMLTVQENLACFAASACLPSARQHERIRICLASAQLETFTNTRAEQLSGGLKRRLNLAIALLPEPELIVFDEPTVGVDPQSRAFILQAITTLAEQGASVIYTSHYMDEIEAIAQEVVILDQGQVVRAGPLASLLQEGGTVLTLGGPNLQADQLTPFGQVTPLGERFRVALRPPHTPPQVLANLEHQGICITQADFGRHHLEHVFMTLTHRSLRDS